MWYKLKRQREENVNMRKIREKIRKWDYQSGGGHMQIYQKSYDHDVSIGMCHASKKCFSYGRSVSVLYIHINI